MASTLSHQLGHNLGLAHDSNVCGCNTSIRPQSRKCIMEAPTGIMPGLSFSGCSQQRFREILRSNQVGCLLDQPEPTRLENSHCGNRLILVAMQPPANWYQAPSVPPDNLAVTSARCGSRDGGLRGVSESEGRRPGQLWAESRRILRLLR
ncbi:hypothetical protein L345_14800, partial [Ophiophagus hannah]